MADIVVKVLTPATCFDLVSLAELKLALGISAADTTQDEALQQMITQYSDVVSVQCNRVFAKERVRETWREVENHRMFLGHWPVAETDVESVECPAGSLLAPGAYELEERSGKLTIFNGGIDSAIVTYTGGFVLPDDAPDALKAACILEVRGAKTQASREATSGIRSIMHKEARIMFFDGTGSTGGGTSSASSASQSDAVRRLLYHFTRLEC